MTNNNEINELGGVLRPVAVQRDAPAFLDPGTYRHLNGFRYDALNEVDPDLIPARGVQWMPRVNVAWNMDGESNNVLRGGSACSSTARWATSSTTSALRNAPTGYFTNVTANDAAAHRQPAADLRHGPQPGRLRARSLGFDQLPDGAT